MRLARSAFLAQRVLATALLGRILRRVAERGDEERPPPSPSLTY